MDHTEAIGEILNTNIKIIIFGGSAGADICSDIFRQSFSECEILFCNTYSKNVSPDRIIGSEIAFDKIKNEGYEYFISTGDNSMRYEMYKELKLTTEKEPINCIHKSSIISDSTKLGDGILICANTVINTNAVIKTGSIINTSSVVEHDCIVGFFSQISPNATLCGRVRVGDRCFISAGSTIIPGLEIGDDVLVAAGSVVINNIPSKVMVAGVPSKIKKKYE